MKKSKNIFRLIKLPLYYDIDFMKSKYLNRWKDIGMSVWLFQVNSKTGTHTTISKPRYRITWRCSHC